ncbi:MAG: ATP-binding protein [Candidatus Theseobacter exili]|nr:ATP-binding protein [Candidatus Theseobacter exili]
MTIKADLHSKSRIIIPNNLCYIPLLLNYVQDLSKQIGFDEKNIRKIQVAVEEASVNVIQNAFSPDEDAEFELTFIKMQHGLEICIHDKGLPVDQSMRPDYVPDISLEDQTGRGLGVFLMKKFVDVYEFHNLGLEGRKHGYKVFRTKSIIDETNQNLSLK